MSVYAMQHMLLAQAPNCRKCMCMQGFRFTEQSLWDASQASADTMQGMPSHCSFQQFEQELCKRLMVLLDSSKSSKPAIAMLKQFRDIAVKHFQTEEVLRKLVDMKQIDLAIDWAAQSGHDLQVKMALYPLQIPNPAPSQSHITRAPTGKLSYWSAEDVLWKM